MGSRQRYLRPLMLFVMMAFLSLSLVGRIDSRLNIGGFEWGSDVLIDKEDPETTEVETSNTIGIIYNNNNNSDEDGLNNSALNTFLEDNTPPLSVEEEQVEEIKVVKVDADAIPNPQIPSPEEQREQPTILIHTVRSGETLWDIAQSYGITVSQIASSNNIANSNRIRIGQELKILTVKGVLHKVAYGESLWEIAQRYEVPLAELIEVNKIADSTNVQPGSEVVIPGATQLRIRDAVIVNGQLQKAFDWPARARISSTFGERWGRMHYGLDIAVATGTPIKAAADGRVTFSGTNGGYGIMVILDHGNGVETRYAHHSRNLVSVGQQVKRGDVIAYSGNTGVSTGPHLHFEIRHNNVAVDPQRYLKD